MLYSMTGFGRSCAEFNNKKITVEIKSLNSKQLDLSVRLPMQYRAIESELRSMALRILERGKADLTVIIESTTPELSTQINLNAVKAYKEQIEKISEATGIPCPTDWYQILTRLPDVIVNSTPDADNGDDCDFLIRCATQAMEDLMTHRRAEGLKLENFFTSRIDAIRELLNQVPQYEEERLVRIRKRIEEGLEKISLPEYDKGRLEQEMIFYIEKLDINEEKQRLRQHLDYFVETMNGKAGQGKKLGFIAQEMGREINTLGSKSNHAEMQILVVKMKDELEQIKEQVLNVM